MAHQKESYPALSIPNLLGLEELDIEYIHEYPDGEVWINDDIRVIHGNVARAKSGATASAVVDDIQETTIFGHIHRRESAAKTVWRQGKPHVIEAWSFGCVCRIDGVVPSKNGRENWQQGVGIVKTFYDGRYTITPIPIFDGCGYYEGKIYGQIGKEIVTS